MKKVPLWRKLLPLIGIGLLIWIISRQDLAQMGQAWLTVPLSTIFVAMLLFSGNLAIKALRWRRLLRFQSIDIPTPGVIAAFFEGQFYGQVSIGRVGEFYRAEALVAHGVPLGEALSSCLFDRLLDVTIVLSLGVVLGAFVVGNWEAAMWARQWSMSGCSSGAEPGRVTMTANSASPRRASGTPMTAHSWMSGWR